MYLKKIFSTACVGFFICLNSFTLASEGIEASYPTTSERWGEGLFIVENTYDNSNRYLKLNDGSLWLLNYTFTSFWDRFKGKDSQAQWLAPDKIEIRRSSNHQYPYLLLNLDTRDSVEARQINPILILSNTLEKIGNAVTIELTNLQTKIQAHKN